MTRWDAFADVCGYLRAGLLGGKPPQRRRNRDWKLLIEMSSFDFVTPSLAGCLHGQPGVPREIRDYLDAVLTLNGQRNELLLEALSRIVAALNAIDIEPVLLKGCARLVEGDYPQSNMRILGDLDVLVPMNRATDAYAALMANGFGEIEDDWAPDHHHLPMLRTTRQEPAWKSTGNYPPRGYRPHHSRRPGFAREPGRSACKMICTPVCPTRPAALASISYITSFTTWGIGKTQSNYANFSTSHSCASDTRRRSTGPNSIIIFVESTWGKRSRPICNFARSCWGKRRHRFAAGPGSVRSMVFAGLSIHRNHQNHRNHRNLPLS
jgi:hypothetical protein